MIKNIPYFTDEVHNSFQYINSIQGILPAIIIKFMNKLHLCLLSCDNVAVSDF